MRNIENLPFLEEVQAAGQIKNVRNIPYVPKCSVSTEKMATMTYDEVIDAYRGHTERRAYEILTNMNEIKPIAGANAYYFSSFAGNDENDGLTPKTPFKTLEKLDNLALKSGDVVYFERGSIWRRGFSASTDGVTYTAFGEGTKPEFYSSPVNAAKYGEWIETDEPDVYVYSYRLVLEKELGSIIFNHGQCWAVKCIVAFNKDGTTYDNTTGEPFTDYHDLKQDLHFYSDYQWQSGYIYLRCEAGNPAEVFEDIEFNIRTNIFRIMANNITLDNLCAKYTGCHGVGCGTRDGLTVQNCVFEWIGGSVFAGVGAYGRNYATRLGNAVEVYGGATNLTVRNNYINQIYDTGITFQYNCPEDRDVLMKDILIKDNVIDNCCWSFEYWLTGGKGETYIENVSVTDNLMWNSGYGLCEERPDKNDTAHIKGWWHGNACRGNFTITNNLLAYGKSDLIQTNAEVTEDCPTYSGNTYIQHLGGKLGCCKDVKNSVIFDADVKDAISTMLEDEDPSVIFVSTKCQ